VFQDEDLMFAYCVQDTKHMQTVFLYLVGLGFLSLYDRAAEISVYSSDKNTTVFKTIIQGATKNPGPLRSVTAFLTFAAETF